MYVRGAIKKVWGFDVPLLVKIELKLCFELHITTAFCCFRNYCFSPRKCLVEIDHVINTIQALSFIRQTYIFDHFWDFHAPLQCVANLTTVHSVV